MERIRVRGTLRKVGNSVALLIPASAARAGALKAGEEVEADLHKTKDDALGFLADIYDGPYLRRDWVGRDRY